MSQNVANVSVELSSGSINAVPGETYDLGVTLTNNSREVERFELAVTGLEPGWYQFDWNNMLLYPDAPGNEGTAYLRITIPPDTRPVTYSPAVQITDGQGNVLTHPFLLLVSPVENLEPEMALTPPSLLTRDKMARFLLQAKNPLNRPIRLSLNARAARPDVQVRLVPPFLDLNPFTEGAASIEVQPRRRNLAKKDQEYDFLIGAENLPRPVAGRMVQTARLPWLRWLLERPWLIALLALLLLGLIALLVFLLWPRSQANNGPATLPAASCVVPTNTLVASLQVNQGTTDIMVSEADGSRLRRVAQESSDRLPGLYKSLVSISPNGTTLAYITARNETMDDAVLYTVNISTQTKQRITNIANGYWPFHPVWSADGNRLGYVVRNGAQLELWTVNLTAPKPQALTTNLRQLEPSLFYGDPGDGPLCWSSDNTRLIIRASNSFKQVEVNADTGVATPDVTRPTLVAKPAASKTTLNQPQLAPVGEGSCFVPVFSQNDPAWRDQLMRTRNDKIGVAGCPLVTSAMMLNYYKVNTDPNDLNSNCLGDSASPWLDWTLPATRCSQGQMQGGQRQDFQWESLNSQLKNGPVVVGLLGGQTGTHYVVVVGGSDNIASTYRVNDPWDGTNFKSLDYFLTAGYQPRWIINYSGPNAPTCPDRTSLPQPFQPGFKLISPLDGEAYNQPVPLSFQADPGVTVAARLSTLNTGSAPISATNGTTGALPTQPTSQNLSNGQTIDQEGSYALTLENTGDPTSPARLTTHFILDRTPPSLTLGTLDTVFEPNNTPGSRFIARKAVPIQFIASDNLSGVASIEYRVNGGDWQLYTTDTTPGPLTFDKPGDYDLVYRATDGAGNRTAEQTLSFTISLATNTDANGTPVPGVIVPGTNNNAAATTTAAAATTTTAAAVATTEQPTPVPTVAVPTLPPTPPVLNVVPTQVNFDATQNQTTIQLINPGTSPVVWGIQPPSGPAATYLLFSQTSGVIQPGGTQTLTIQLAVFNITTSPVSAQFFLTYNNNTSLVPVAVTINQQPTPNVQFVAPASGPITILKLPVKLQVQESGQAKANHATISASFISQLGGSPTEQILPGQANPGNDWTITWDTTALPPQSPISLNTNICWTADETACVKNVASLAGLSIPKPTGTVNLAPNSSTLSGPVAVTAQVSGIVDHVSYSYTFKDATGATTTQAARGSGANYAFTWDPSNIPPQTGITFSALICWGQDDNPANCVAPTNQLPSSFTVPAPALTVNPLSSADQTSLPLTVNLNGTVTNLGRSTIFVFVKASKATGPNGTPLAPTEEAFTANPPQSGSTNWTFSIDTSTWPSQAGITFTPKVCWDGNPNGTLCFPSQPASLTAAIADLTATFASSTAPDLSAPVDLKVIPTPATRVAFVKYLVTYISSLDGSTKTDQPLLVGQADQTNGFTYKFDSVLLGLKSLQTVTFKLQACNFFNYCGPISSGAAPNVLTSAQIPDSVFTLVTPANLANAVNTISSIPVTMTGTISGRGAKSLTLYASYLSNPMVSNSPIMTTSLIPVYNPAKGQTTAPISWDTSSIPPQNGTITLSYQFCWGPGIDLDTNLNNCGAFKPVATNLSTPVPVVSDFYLNSGLKYPKDGAGNLLDFPVAISATNSFSTTLSIPVEADITANSSVISMTWKASGTPASPAVEVSTLPLPPTNIQHSSRTYVTRTVTVDAGGNVTPANFTIVGTPVWKDPFSANVVPYTSSQITLTVHVVKATALMYGPLVGGGSGDGSLLAGGNGSSLKLMFSEITKLQGTFSANPNNSIQRLLLNTDFVPFRGITVTNAAGANLTNGGQNWNFDWDHTLPTSPKPTPDDNITLNWQLCSADSTTDPTNASCTPTDLTGSASQASNLKLAGIRQLPNSTLSPNAAFPSTFTASVQLSQGLTYGPAATDIVKSIRFWAYPTGNPGFANPVLLTPRGPFQTVSTNPTTLNVDLYWPDNDPNLDNLITALQGNQAKISIGAQLCTATPGANQNDPNCNDFSGTKMQKIDPNWVAVVTGTQPVILTWQPYYYTATLPVPPPVAGTSPYDDYLFSKMNAPALTVFVRPITTTLDICSANPPTADTLSFAAIANGGVDTVANYPGTATRTASTNGNCYVTFPWPVLTSLPNLPVDATNATHSVTLQANFNHNGATLADSFNTKAEVDTHGTPYALPGGFIKNIVVTPNPANSPTQVKITWDTDPAFNTDGKVILTPQGGGAAYNQTETNPLGTTHSIVVDYANLIGGKTYTVQVVSTGAGSPVTANTATTFTVLAITNLTITPSATNVIISWNTNPAADGTITLTPQGGGAVFTQNNATVTTNHSFTVPYTSLIIGKTYDVQVTSTQGTTTATATVPNAFTINLTISNITVTPTGTDVTIKWDTNLGADSTITLTPQGGGAAFTQTDATVVTNHAFTVQYTSLIIGKTYNVQVQSAAGVANVTANAPTTFTVNLVISNITATTSATGVTISWNTNLGADSAITLTPQGGGAAFTQNNAAVVTTHTFTVPFTSLLAGKTYDVQVTSAAGVANVSAAGPTFPTPAAPTITGGPTATPGAAGSGIVTIAWTTDIPADGQVEYWTATTAHTLTPVNATLTQNHTFVIPTPLLNTTYSFIVYSTSQAGYSVQSGTFTVISPLVISPPMPTKPVPTPTPTPGKPDPTPTPPGTNLPAPTPTDPPPTPTPPPATPTPTPPPTSPPATPTP
jgi:hypothetical protein